MTAPLSVPRSVIEARNRQDNIAAASLLRDLSYAVGCMSDALHDDDQILGPLASEAVADALAALPKRIRDAFAEHLTDEAARSLRADELYLAELTQGGHNQPPEAGTPPKGTEQSAA